MIAMPRSERYSLRVQRALLLSAVFFCSVLPARSQIQLPEGNGKQDLERVCTLCHELDELSKVNMNRADWGYLVERMVAYGAPLPKDRVPVVAEYLAKSFPGTGKPAAVKITGPVEVRIGEIEVPYGMRAGEEAEFDDVLHVAVAHLQAGHQEHNARGEDDVQCGRERQQPQPRGERSAGRDQPGQDHGQGQQEVDGVGGHDGERNHRPRKHGLFHHGAGVQDAHRAAAHRLRDWTDGCIAITNEEMDEFLRLVRPGTPIEIKP